MIDMKSLPIVLHADAEHGNLRTAVVVLLAVVIVVIFLLLNAIWPAIAPAGLVDFSFVITCTSAIFLGVVAVWGIEKGLKQVWHSGRSLSINESSILIEDEELSFKLHWDGHINLLHWRFVLKGYKRGGRERRVPENWVCLATQMQEGAERVVVYCYTSPKLAEEFLDVYGREQYHEINLAEVFSKAMKSNLLSIPSRPDKIPNEYLTGKDGLYWLAEQTRWRDGFELSLSDYETFLKSVNSFQQSPDKSLTAP